MSEVNKELEKENQSQKELAISELGKLVEFVKTNESPSFSQRVDGYWFLSTRKLLDYLHSQIKDLKENKMTLNISDENEILPAIKQQIKSQPAEIVEKIKEFCLTNHKFKECEIYLREDNGQTIYDFLDNLLKEYQK